ncbi:signal recognition particle-docking protein FtsY [Gloeobacter violaceus]|uniref:Signal recognition particle receptor FtsY n=1 Tax=Gloeobacter violaceus (strain ATCC 29082 / PCC 7421) TaxID=251221 RepID=Q7NP07_GLOVI|nr:signal recognition particle-docking protein FtsY [Gloeobacter violaceus]BAC88192.1 glr0251 [Gloeobacter violaceus PCC 7421]
MVFNWFNRFIKKDKKEEPTPEPTQAQEPVEAQPPAPVEEPAAEPDYMKWARLAQEKLNQELAAQPAVEPEAPAAFEEAPTAPPIEPPSAPAYDWQAVLYGTKSAAPVEPPPPSTATPPVTEAVIPPPPPPAVAPTPPAPEPPAAVSPAAFDWQAVLYGTRPAAPVEPPPAPQPPVAEAPPASVQAAPAFESPVVEVPEPPVAEPVVEPPVEEFPAAPVAEEEILPVESEPLTVAEVPVEPLPEAEVLPALLVAEEESAPVVEPPEPELPAAVEISPVFEAETVEAPAAEVLPPAEEPPTVEEVVPSVEAPPIFQPAAAESAPVEPPPPAPPAEPPPESPASAPLFDWRRILNRNRPVESPPEPPAPAAPEPPAAEAAPPAAEPPVFDWRRFLNRPRTPEAPPVQPPVVPEPPPAPEPVVPPPPAAAQTPPAQPKPRFELDPGFLWSAEVLAAQGRRPEDVTVEEISWLQKLRAGLGRTRRSLVNNVKALAGRGPIGPDELEELEGLLLQADVGITVSERILAALQERVRREALPGDQVMPFLKSQLRKQLELEGDDPTGFAPKRGQLNVWLIVGVNGVGKTTTIGKIAALATRSGYRTLIAAGDTFRAAAVEQLSIWGERSGVTVVANPSPKADPAAVVFDAISAAKARDVELLLVDTAGRLQNKKNLMDELAKVRRIIDKQAIDAHIESLLVLDATTGQNGLQQAKVFGETAGLTGVVITKLDGSAKAGIALAIVEQLQLPIRFVGVGEKIDDLRPFNSYEFVEALLSDYDAA